MIPRTPLRKTASRRDQRVLQPQPEQVTERVDRLGVQLQELRTRLDRTEGRLELLETTLHAVAREAGLSIGCPCSRCERSYLLVSDGLMHCPKCGYRQSI